MRESPPPPQSLCSAESERASGRGRGAGRRGAGGAGSARLTPSARSVLAPPRPGPGGGPPPLPSLRRGVPHTPLALLASTDPELPLCSQGRSRAPVLSSSPTWQHTLFPSVNPPRFQAQIHPSSSLQNN